MQQPPAPPPAAVEPLPQQQLPAPPPAAAGAPPRPVLPEEDSNFAELAAASQFDAAAASERVEVRIQKRLSELHLNAPVEFGLFARRAIAAGEEVTPYGGILRHVIDARKLPLLEQTHIRRLGNDFVLDGLPLANMLHRPIPRTAEELKALIAAGSQARQPTSASFAAADLHRFAASAFGFMANTDRSHRGAQVLALANVKIDKKVFKMAGVSYPVPVLVATRAIATGEEIISPYGKQASPEPPAAAHPSNHMATHLWTLLPPNEESTAVASEWLSWGQQQHASRWEHKRNSWWQLAAEERDDPEMWERGRLAGRSCLRAALLAGAHEVHMVSQKLLRSAPGGGLQNEHCDAATLALAQGCYSVLIYLTAGQSTAVPVKPHTLQAQRICWSSSAQAASAIRADIPLSTHPVQPGAAMVLSHIVLHHAPRNDTASDRVVLFQHWISKKLAQVPDSEDQRLPFGFDS